MFAIPFAVALTLAVPQSPPAVPPEDLAALAARVDATHHPKGPVEPITALRGDLAVQLLDRDADKKGTVELHVQFLQWSPPDSSRIVPLIRYEVGDAGETSVRGRDRNGPWQLFGGTAQDLRKAQFQDDLAACERHTNLARQLLRFLDPAAVLRALQDPSPVTATELRLQRTAVPCETVSGRLAAFPLLQQAGEDAPVRLQVFVEKATGRLVAIEACPLRDGVPDEARLEHVDLLEPTEQDGLLVPRRIVHQFRKPNGEMQAQLRTTLTALSLRPELEAKDFDRPK